MNQANGHTFIFCTWKKKRNVFANPIRRATPLTNKIFQNEAAKSCPFCLHFPSQEALGRRGASCRATRKTHQTQSGQAQFLLCEYAMTHKHTEHAHNKAQQRQSKKNTLKISQIEHCEEASNVQKNWAQLASLFKVRLILVIECARVRCLKNKRYPLLWRANWARLPSTWRPVGHVSVRAPRPFLKILMRVRLLVMSDAMAHWWLKDDFGFQFLTDVAKETGHPEEV